MKGIQWWFWYAIIECHHLSPSWVLKYKKGWKEHWVPVGEVTTQVPWAGVDHEQEGTPGVWEPLRSSYTDVYGYSCIDDCTERFKAKIWLSWYPFRYKSAEKEPQQRVVSTTVHDLRGIWHTQLLGGDNCLFHLPDILEMLLVIVVFASKANMRLVCLQP